MTTTARPNPIQWLAYAYGAGLPTKYREWVLHDVSAPTWRLRHIARAVAQLAPIAVLLYVFIPGEPWVRLTAVLAGLILGFLYSSVYMPEAAEHRAVKAGYPKGEATTLRESAHAGERLEEAERYALRWRQGA